MAKNIRRILAMVMVMAMFVTVLPMQTLAAETDTVTETTTETNGGLTTQITTNTTTSTDEETGNITVTVEIKKETSGIDETGATVTGSETTKTETTTDSEGTELDHNWSVNGEETKLWDTEEDNLGDPSVSVTLKPGETTTGVAKVEGTEKTETSTEKDGTVVTETTYEADRTVTADTTEEESKVIVSEATMDALQPELKFDRNDANDQSAKKKETELYTDNGHFHNPDNYTVTDAPEAYPFEYVGHGDYSGHYVSHVRVIYERDKDGNPVKDENGEYIIKELQHVGGTTLTKNGVPTTDLNGPYDQPTGTRPQQFLLKNENGDVVYGYCIDLETGAETGKYYQVANLEDNDYYASEEAENHVRNIVTNGYWGTAEGTGSMAKIKDDLKAAVASGNVDKEYDISFMIQENYTEGYELKDGETIYTNSKGQKFIHRVVTEHIVLTDEVIDAFTEGEALDATQSAIWSFANGSKYALDGTDRMIVGDITYASSALGDSLNGRNDFAGAARTLAFYNYLISLDDTLDSTVVVNDKNNVEDINLVIGDKVADESVTENYDDNADNDVYNAELNFSLAFIPGEKDEMYVCLMDSSNQPILGEDGQPIKKLLAAEDSEKTGEDVLKPVDGVYTLSGLKLSENSEFEFDLRLEGTQYLENGVYIYTAQGGVGASQTFVSMGEGTNTVDVSKSMTITFDVDETNHIVAERKWQNDGDPVNPPEEPIDPPAEEEDPPQIFRLDPEAEEEIPEEPVPLAEPVVTGDNSFLWGLVVVMAVLGMAVVNLTSKKNYAA